ncbi:isoamylase [Isosphaeraceae bacterium EP7]
MSAQIAPPAAQGGSAPPTEVENGHVVVQHLFHDQPLRVSRGRPLPLGATNTQEGVNFALVCREGTSVTLVVSEPCSPEIAAEILLDPELNRTGEHWHVRVKGLPDEFCYGYRVDGPKGLGHRFNPANVLIDPASRALSCGRPWGKNVHSSRRSLLNRHMGDEESAIGPRVAREDTILYEMHVRGYTIDPSSAVRNPGTFAGLTEKLGYLKELGITAVELLPIDEFDEDACPFFNPMTGRRLRDYWGYNPIAYAAPKAAYSSQPEGVGAWDEFRWMVRAFHDQGIEVVLDVVFNHTGEGGEHGPTYSFRGLDNLLYYMMDDHGRYMNFSGCGNTVNSNHPVVRGLILSCLRSLVVEAGVDGFRFDLASVLGRDNKGNVLLEPPVIEMISEDSLLADTQMIAEPWDAAGLYQVGSFPGGSRWGVWNGRYRDDVRRFWTGEPGQTSALATRLCGSDDLHHGGGPLHSINFVTCHDGFTLNDLVSYNAKHNEANGEGNRDGADANMSWNCGVEGPTNAPEVLAIRRRQVRNLMATLMVSQGVPMLLGGDELLRTQEGNNNAWCQDNAISWLDWGLVEENADFLRFTREMIALRKRHPVLRRKTFMSGQSPPEVTWHGTEPCRPNFGPESRGLAMILDGRRCDRPGVVDRDIYVVFNSDSEPVTYKVPASPSGRAWRRAVDTSLPSPDDAVGLDQGPRIEVLHPYRVEARSMLILVSEEH